MAKKALRKNSLREIKQSIGRFIAIMAIVALGVGLFSGLKVTKKAMILTEQHYYDANNFYDFRLISTLGLYDEDVEAFKALSFVKEAEGAYSLDVIIEREDNTSSVAKFHSLSDKINKSVLIRGRMPESADECLMDSKWFSEEKIGEKLRIAKSNSDSTKDMLVYDELTIVGVCQSSLYINFERGNTTLGNGKIGGFVYVLPELFDCDYYTEVYALTDAGSERVYSEKYDDIIEAEKEQVETLLDERATIKYREIMTEAEDKISDAEKKISDALIEIEDNEKKVSDARKEISDGEKEIADGQIEIADRVKELSDGEKALNDSEASVRKSLAELDDAETALNDMEMFVSPAEFAKKKTEIAYAREALNQGIQEIESKRIEIEEGKKKIAEAKEELNKAKEDIEKAKSDIEEATAELEKARKEIEEHQAELDDAKEDLSELDTPDTYVLTRATNIGYACFDNDSSIVEGVSNVFPAFFFLVAALVCMTTMNRMVEEKRTEIGTMKALGYSEASIMGKYLFYSGSAAIMGCIAGFIIGSKIFPSVIWKAYGIMYSMPDIEYVFDLKLAIISGVVSVACSIGATYVTLYKELRSHASDLIRPKAPANGKRVFLEKIGFIWKKMKFTSKVSVRNVFRYKKRFWMMVLGVGGCYGLLITGFGIKDSVADVCDCQFNIIQKYDITVAFKDGTPPEERSEFEESLKENDDYIYTSSKSVDVDANGKIKSATMVVFPTGDKEKSLSDFINFTDNKNNTLSLPSENEAILTEKMAKAMGIGVGDSVVLRDPDLNEIIVTVSGIMTNYVYNWAYISSDTFKEQRGIEPDYNTAFVKNEGDNYEIGAKLGSIEYVSSVSVSDELSERIGNMMSSLNQIVYVVILCAASLAFIVMYNLTNINITERLREIATLKVLGFYPMETSVYVFRENMILTAIGIVAGLFMGFGLHRYVMYNITVEAVSFDTKILPQSYMYGVVLTFLFALIVDFALFFKLEKIKMAESLKSVE